jgi:hypothetical protein
MKLCLALPYRLWIWMLLPTALEAGTALLSLVWPGAIKPNTLTLRSRRRIRWGEVATIKLCSAYKGGPITRINVQPGRSSIAVGALRAGQDVAAITPVSEAVPRNLSLRRN